MNSDENKLYQQYIKALSEFMGEAAAIRFLKKYGLDSKAIVYKLAYLSIERFIKNNTTNILYFILLLVAILVLYAQIGKGI